MEPRLVDLADRGRGERGLVEARERFAQRTPEVALEDLFHASEGEGIRPVVEAPEDAADDRAVLLRHELGRGRHELSCLEGEALEVREDAEGLLRDLLPEERIEL